MEESQPKITGDNRRPDGTFGPGNIANPNGRPKGSISIKDRVRQHLEAHPEDVEEIVSHFVKNNRELMWQMLEGRPAQAIDAMVDSTMRIDISEKIAEKYGLTPNPEQSSGE